MTITSLIDERNDLEALYVVLCKQEDIGNISEDEVDEVWESLQRLDAEIEAIETTQRSWRR